MNRIELISFMTSYGQKGHVFKIHLAINNSIKREREKTELLKRTIIK